MENVSSDDVLRDETSLSTSSGKAFVMLVCLHTGTNERRWKFKTIFFFVAWLYELKRDNLQNNRSNAFVAHCNETDDNFFIYKIKNIIKCEYNLLRREYLESDLIVSSFICVQILKAFHHSCQSYYDVLMETKTNMVSASLYIQNILETNKFRIPRGTRSCACILRMCTANV